MRVLHVTPHFYPALAYGGVARAVYELARRQAAAGHDVTVYTSDVYDRDRRLPVATGKAVDLQGMRIFYFSNLFLSMATRFNVYFTPGLVPAALANVDGFDLIHIHGLFSFDGSVVSALARKYRVPYVLSVHGMLSPSALAYKAAAKRLYQAVLGRAVLRDAGALHAMTDRERLQLIHAGAPPDRIHVVPNGVSLSEFDEGADGGAFRFRWGVPQDAAMILSIGRLHPQKGIDLLLDALSTLAPSSQPVWTVIVGPSEGGYGATVRHKIRGTPLEPVVVFTGFLGGQDRIAAYAAADVVAIPSQSEAMALVALEAGAAGRPLVMTRGSSLPEVKEFAAGFVVESDRARFADALSELVNDTSLRQTMGRNARRMVEARFGWDRVSPRMESVYHAAMTRQTVRAGGGDEASDISCRIGNREHATGYSGRPRHPARSGGSLRLLYVIPYFAPAWAYGGPPRVCYDMARFLVARGHSVRVLTTDALDGTGRTATKDQVLDGVQVWRSKNVSNRLAWDQKVFVPLGFSRVLERSLHATDVAHLHDFRTFQNAAGIGLLQRHRVPYVLSAFGELPRASGVKRPVKFLYDLLYGYRLVRYARLLLAQTDEEAACYRRFGGRDEQIRHVPLGVDLEELRTLRSAGEYRRKLGISASALVILFLGRIHKYKGLDLLIHAFARIRAERDDVHLVIAGRDDGYLADAEALASRLAPPGSILFPGPVYEGERFSAYRDADVFAITPSHDEQTSLAALEACACGTPVLVTEQAPIPGLDAAAAGLTVPYEVEAVSTGLASLLDAPEERRRMGERAAELIRTRFSLASVATVLESVYEEARSPREALGIRS